MEINRKLIDNAAQLPEKELSELIYAVITAAGGSRMQARAAASHAEKVRQKLQSVSMDEVRDLTKNIDGQTMEKVLEVVKKSGVGNG